MSYRINAGSKRRLALGAGLAVVALIISQLALTSLPRYGHFVVLAISVTLVSVGVRRARLYARAAKWLPIKATVLDIREDCLDVILHDGALRHYYPAIKYQYAFQGISYISDRVGFDVENIWVPALDGWGVKTDDAAKFWHAWTSGTEITAYINGRNPSESVIVNKMTRKAKSQQMALLTAGVLVGILWFYLAYVSGSSL
jgi:Protein of unknown function (DUF3592)